MVAEGFENTTSIILELIYYIYPICIYCKITQDILLQESYLLKMFLGHETFFCCAQLHFFFLITYKNERTKQNRDTWK